MALEMHGKGNVNMVMDAPPSYQSKDRTKVYIVAVTVIVVSVLVGFFGVFYLLLSAPTPTVINNVSNEVEESEPNIITREVEFDMGDGLRHHESMVAEGDILTIRSVGENFVAVFDHGKNIVMIKNQTSSTCYFTRLEEIPDMGMDDMDNVRPFYFKELEPGTEPSPAVPYVEIVTFEQAESIPMDYMTLTNGPAISSLCSDGDSYWLIPGEDDGIVKRQGSIIHRMRALCIHIKITITIRF